MMMSQPCGIETQVGYFYAEENAFIHEFLEILHIPFSFRSINNAK